jgi:hypothetical protein
MAVIDDVGNLAAQDVVYLSRTFRGDNVMTSGSTEVFRGRLRQALSGDWVFNASTGQNGVVGFVLGGVDNTWTSNESPAAGIQVTITRPVLTIMAAPPMASQDFLEQITLTSIIPPDFAD